MSKKKTNQPEMDGAKGYTFLMCEGGKVEICYHLSGNLAYVNFEEDVSAEQREWVLQRVFVKGNTPEEIKKYLKQIDLDGKVSIVPPVVDFNAFWKIWKNKVSKGEAEKAWKRLPKADQKKVMVAVSRYNTYILKTGIAYVYPAKFMNKQRYLDFI